MAYIRKTTELIISDDLRSVLLEMQESSVVARLFLKKRTAFEDLKENYVDYLSISREDRTKLSYLSVDRIERLEKSGGDLWTSSSRFHARPASVIRKVFNDVTDKDIEIFNNVYRAHINQLRFELKVVKGEDIRKYYHYPSYQQQSSSLGASCMKYDNCQKYLNIYVDNTETISMLVMLDKGTNQLMGRALLWDLGEDKIMDRIYTINDDELAFHFKKWANDNAYLYKYEQKWNNTLMFESNGKRFEKEISLQLKNFDYGRYPYFDTFKFLNVRNGMLYNYLPEDKDNLKTLSTPDGVYHNHDIFAFDFISRVFQHRGDTVKISYRDGVFITDENYRTHQSNVCWSESNNCYILCKDSVYNESIDDQLFNSELDHLNNKSAIEDRMAYIKRREEERLKRDEERRRIFEGELRERERRVQREPDISEPFEDLFGQIFRTGIPSSYLGSRLRRSVVRHVDQTETVVQNETVVQEELRPTEQPVPETTVSLNYDYTENYISGSALAEILERYNLSDNRESATNESISEQL